MNQDQENKYTSFPETAETNALQVGAVDKTKRQIHQNIQFNRHNDISTCLSVCLSACTHTRTINMLRAIGTVKKAQGRQPSSPTIQEP